MNSIKLISVKRKTNEEPRRDTWLQIQEGKDYYLVYEAIFSSIQGINGPLLLILGEKIEDETDTSS